MKAIRDCGYRVIEAVASDEALPLLAAPHPSFDVIIVDMAVEGRLHGFGLARVLRAECPKAELVLTASLERLTDEVEELCGRDTVISKPYQKQLLVRRIQALMTGRRRK